MRVLIVGAGIAGPTLAYWLRRAGHVPLLVEQSPGLRTGGYLVDFWGAGFDVAGRMGIVPTLLKQGIRFREVRQVASDGHQIASLDALRFFPDGGDRYVSIARSALAATIYAALDGEVETVFGDTVAELDDDGDKVHVTLESGAHHDVDLVVGADGLHSRVRELAFGPESGFEKDLGITVAALELEGYRPRDDLVAMMYTEVGMQLTRLSLPGDVTMALFTFRDDEPVPLGDVDAQQELLRRRLAGCGWEVPAILDAMPTARSFYLDRASQIRMPTWTSGRVALVGDAAASPSLLAGQGSALAMVEAYVLADRLRQAGGDHAAAFADYEQALAPAIRRKQKAAVSLGVAFAPANRAQLLLRNTMVRAMALPALTRLAMGRSIRDAIELPPPD
ncbi:2-polyprenyl-6-methoxyphenol hydroxylase [Paramicrobacterium humi]|uniref:2-polyprenyl-6-methoxyphenol hydroxylase n=1 Tax=Paramicrobacterium humi TaxID=640635 RepID=A0A1H4M3F2_9MICO|nr:FAD-binding domain [Microbacterium humi]SEB77569.1 2-polyprenyl-6-methoxyphenol hydroxylase [Microbacterium humi]